MKRFAQSDGFSFIASGVARFFGVKMTLSASALHDFAAFGFFKSFGRGLVCFYFVHMFNFLLL